MNSPLESDECLLARICQDDRQALAELFRRYAVKVRGIATRLLHDRQEAEDMVQEVFLLVHRDCHKFDPSRCSASFWILQMTHFRAISRHRYLTSRQFYRHAEVEELADVLPSPASSSELDAVVSRGMLGKMFEALSPDQRETLRLYFFEGYTLPEIASKRGKILGTVKNHFYRGLDRLRRQIFEEKPLPPWTPRSEDADEPPVATRRRRKKGRASCDTYFAYALFYAELMFLTGLRRYESTTSKHRDRTPASRDPAARRD